MFNYKFTTAYPKMAIRFTVFTVDLMAINGKKKGTF